LKQEAIKAEANSEAFDFLRSRKRKHFSSNIGSDVEGDAGRGSDGSG